MVMPLYIGEIREKGYINARMSCSLPQNASNKLLFSELFSIYLLRIRPADLFQILRYTLFERLFNSENTDLNNRQKEHTPLSVIFLGFHNVIFFRFMKGVKKHLAQQKKCE